MRAVAVAAWLLLVCAGSAAVADEMESPLTTPLPEENLPEEKKLRELALKARAAAPSPVERERYHAFLDRRIGDAPARVVNIYNTWTKEFLSVEVKAGKKKARDAGGPVAQDEIDTFFRCHFTNQPADMDPRLFQALVAAARHFVSPRVDIVSGFRSPKYNLILRKKGREVARNSQHTLGHAVDFRVRGVPVRHLEKWAKRLRLGGVGTYDRSRFIHIDVGPVRSWTGR